MGREKPYLFGTIFQWGLVSLMSLAFGTGCMGRWSTHNECQGTGCEDTSGDGGGSQDGGGDFVAGDSDSDSDGDIGPGDNGDGTDGDSPGDVGGDTGGDDPGDTGGDAPGDMDGDTGGDSDGDADTPPTGTDIVIDFDSTGADVRPAGTAELDRGAYILTETQVRDESLTDPNPAGGVFENTQLTGSRIELANPANGRFHFNTTANYAFENSDATEINSGDLRLAPGFAPTAITSTLEANHPTVSGANSYCDHATFAGPLLSGDFDVSFRFPAVSAGDFYGQFGVAMAYPVSGLERWSSEALVSINYVPEVPGGAYFEKDYGGYDSFYPNGTASRMAHTFRIWRTGSTITASIDGSSWVSNAFTSSNDLYIGIFFLPPSDETIYTLPLTNWSGVQTSPCTAGCWVTSLDADQVSTGSWTDMGFGSINISEPTGSLYRFIFSFDGRTTWKTFDGAAWVETTLTDLMTDGMTSAELSAAPFVDPDAFEIGTTQTIDVGVGVGGDNPSVDAWLDYLEFAFVDHGRYLSQVLDMGPQPLYGNIAFAVRNPRPTFNVRAGPTPTPDASWTAWQEDVRNGDDLSLFNGNRYLQYEIVIDATIGTTQPGVYNLSFAVTEIGYPPEPATVVINPIDISGQEVLAITPETREPTGTEVRWAVSVDGVDWYVHDGSVWQHIAADADLSGVLATQGMSTAALAGLPFTQWPDFTSGASQLYVAFSLSSTLTTETPDVSGVTVTVAAP